LNITKKKKRVGGGGGGFLKKEEIFISLAEQSDNFKK